MRLVTASLARHLSRGFTSESAMKSNTALFSRAPRHAPGSSWPVLVLFNSATWQASRRIRSCRTSSYLAYQRSSSSRPAEGEVMVRLQYRPREMRGKRRGALCGAARRQSLHQPVAHRRRTTTTSVSSAGGPRRAGRCASAAMCDLSHVSSLIAKYMATAQEVAPPDRVCSIRESISSIGSDEAKRAAALQMLQEAAQTAGAAIPREGAPRRAVCSRSERSARVGGTIEHSPCIKRKRPRLDLGGETATIAYDTKSLRTDSTSRYLDITPPVKHRPCRLPRRSAARSPCSATTS